MNYSEISKETFDLLYKTRSSLNQSPLSASIRTLVELRVSQINGCAYCCKIHNEEARKLGFSQEKLDVLPAWRNSTIFSEEERAALNWAESVTYLDKDFNDVKKQLQKFYSERQIVDLTVTISLMNTLNRIAITLRD